MAAEIDANLAIPSAAKTTAAEMVQWTAWYLVNRLTNQNIGIGTTFAGANWTFIDSCDGSAVTPAGNAWTTTFDPALIVQAPAGTAHSWSVIQNATLGIYLIVDCVSESGCDFIFSTTVPSGGTISIRPTSAAEIKFGITAGDGQNMQLNNGDTSIAQYVHTYHDAVENVYFYTSHAGSNGFFSILAVMKCTNTTTGDGSPTVAFFSGNGEPGLSMDPIYSSLFNFDSYGRPSKLRGLDYLSADEVHLAAGIPSVYDGTTYLSPLTTSGYADNVNDGTSYYNEFPLVVFAKGTYGAMKGILPGIKLASGALPQLSEKGAIDAVKINDCWVPWSGATPPAV